MSLQIMLSRRAGHCDIGVGSRRGEATEFQRGSDARLHRCAGKSARRGVLADLQVNQRRIDEDD